MVRMVVQRWGTGEFDWGSRTLRDDTFEARATVFSIAETAGSPSRRDLARAWHELDAEAHQGVGLAGIGVSVGRVPVLAVDYVQLVHGKAKGMSGKIYLLGDDDSLQPMDEEPYEAEALLQELLARYPDLLAGDQLRPSSPRRWLLVSRELGVPGSAASGDRWSIDHLFIDQEGIPTLVEVKRSSNSQIRREVVGQMLDYAANGSAYWSLEQITTAFERRCEREDLDADSVMDEFLDSGWGAREFWQTVKTNLQAGRIRLLFVADSIPAELRRIIEFLNQQMDPAEVLGVEVKQFVGEGRRAMVPRVVGMTAEAEQRKAVTETHYWDAESFMDRISEDRPAAEHQAAQRILDWTEEQGFRVNWGRGVKNGTFSPKAYVNGIKYNMFTVLTDGGVQIQFASMNEPPFDELSKRRALADRLSAAHQSISFDDGRLEAWPSIRLGLLTQADVMDGFLDAWGWFLAEAQDS